VIYQGHHGDVGAHRADVILPAAAYTEQDGTYVNTEGRVQRAYRAVMPPGEAKEDWLILTELASALGVTLPYHSLESLRSTMGQRFPVLTRRDVCTPAPWKKASAPAAVSLKHFDEALRNFYFTCAISRASKTMAQCTEAFMKQTNPHTKAA